MIALEVPLAGIQRIEASAGTGKTWTVAALVARAIAEGRTDVRGMVVVTFTRAATHELRDRIRRRLVDTGRALAGDTEGFGTSDHEFFDGLRETIDDHDQARRRIEAAVRGLDEAAIFTIHGFCQRVLADRAFEARAAFDSDLVQDPGDVLQEAVDAHWRNRLYDGDADLARAVLRGCEDPGTLADRYRGLFARRDLDVLAPEADLAAVRAFREACGPLAVRLAAERADLVAWFATEAFNQGTLRPAWVEGRLVALETLLAAGDPDALDKDGLGKVDKLRPEYVRGAVKKNREYPEPPSDILDDVARVLDLRRSAADASDAAGRAFEADALRTVGPIYRDRKRSLGMVDFDDLLGDLRDALEDDGGAALAARIRERYPFAVVDEFQDTDPTQWEIFRRIWGDDRDGTALVLVGDPKQAIYSFRGADVFAYLAAGRAVKHTRDLDANWRSHPALVEGNNATFSAVDRPFALDEIQFHPVEAARSADDFEPIVEGAEPVLRLRLIPEDELGGRTGTGVGQQVASEAAAREADRMIRAGVAASDIAVLVRTGRQGEAVRAALAARGLSSVLRTHESVFASASADDLVRVLRALASPTDERRVRAALATVTLGVTGEDLAAMAEHGGRWDATLERFRRWHDGWRRRGPARAIRDVLTAYRVESRLLARLDGARRLADLAHLVERVQAAWDGGAHGFDRLLRWVADRRSEDTVVEEDETLRLDSDEDLVRIETVHASKGLEYPYVLCPFPWWMRGRKNDRERFLTYHGGEEGRLVLDLRADVETDVLEAAAREALSEDLRLLYVAMTRAERRCELFWVPTGENLGRTALAWILHDGPRASVLAFAEDAGEVDEDGWFERLARIATRAPDAIDVVRGMPDEPAGDRPGAAVHDGRSRRPARAVGEGRTLTSFTALAGQMHDAADALDRPDWDVVAARVLPVARTDERTRHTFPAGAGAGRAIHLAFESIDFPRAVAGDDGGAVAAALLAHGFDPAWEPVVRAMMIDALTVPIGDRDDGVLAGVGENDRLVELEFTFPVEGPDGTGLEGRALSEVLGAWDDGPIADEIARLAFDRVRGHVRGFIDLLCRIPGADGEDRFWIVDWKSNRLGVDAAAYGRAGMEAEIARHGYWLQYLLYTVAVHRFLRTRLADYDYDRDFGGVAYVFVRGVDPDDPMRGVYRDRPSRALIEAVDRAIGGGVSS